MSPIPRRAVLRGYVRLYLSNGRVTHLLREAGGAEMALCGQSSGLFAHWLGLGSEAERDKALHNPQCIHCERILRRGITRTAS